MKDFREKVAVITGAAGGIGRGLAHHCVAAGMHVVLADIEEGALAAIEDELRTKGARVLSVRTDVSREQDIEALARKTIEAFGAVHLLFNNAGVQVGVQRNVPIWENTPADWEWVMGVNLWGVIHGLRIFCPIMLGQKTECHIVNTASVAGLTSGAEVGIYRVTKGGVITLSETLYLQLKQRNASVGVSVVCPSFVRSRLNDAERNRPAELQNQADERPLTPEEESVLRFFLEHNDNAMSPEEHADLVFQGIRQNRFYILTHPESSAGVRQRMEAILQGRNP